MTFDEINLGNPLKNAIEDIGYIYVTPIQAKAFPLVLSGKDVVGIAQTGTGKTFAYLLPLLKSLNYSEQKHPRVLIMVPTRELVLQVKAEIEKLTKYMNVRHEGIYGGANINIQKKTVFAGLDIIVATPGRLLDLSLDGILRLRSIQKLVIDEVDEMLNLGFRKQLSDVLDMLPNNRQNLMFSATLTPEVELFINDYFKNPIKLEIAAHGTPLEQINQFAYFVPNYTTKVNLLEHLIKTSKDFEKVLIFTSSKRIADLVFEKIDLITENKTGVIHSNKSQNNRVAVLKRFENNEIKYLIATDVIARGIDIDGVSHVINFDLPIVPGDYIHRIGRTGRANQEGVSISFINEVEQEYQMEIEKMMKKFIEILPFPESVEVSDVYAPNDREEKKEKILYRNPSLKNSQGAFHSKKDKNSKTINVKKSVKHKMNKAKKHK